MQFIAKFCLKIPFFCVNFFPTYREEREWRQWVDQKLVHAIPPNIYRTPREALQAFEYISRVGNFGSVERFAAKYLGAISMYVLSKHLKKKYELKPDVRQSLYDYCYRWTKAIGKSRKFMGGKEPNLADLVRNECIILLYNLRLFLLLQYTFPMYFSYYF